MTANYHHTALADVTPGMILSDVLLDPQGQVLLPRGTALTEAIIALLPRHGVDMLPIACPPISADDETKLHDGVERRLAHLYRKHDPDNLDDWASTALRRYIEDFRLDREVAP